MRSQRAQSALEFVMLFIVMTLAVTATYKYVYRSINARLKQVQEYLDPNH